jgi:hypothetical protein
MPLQPLFKAAQADEHINLAALPATLAFTEISGLQSSNQIKVSSSSDNTASTMLPFGISHTLLSFGWSFVTCSAEDIEILAS